MQAIRIAIGWGPGASRIETSLYVFPEACLSPSQLPVDRDPYRDYTKSDVLKVIKMRMDIYV